MSDMSLGSTGKGVPQTFRTAAGNINASYDFYDAAAGLGYKKFYGGLYLDYAGGTDVYFLTPNPGIISPSYGSQTECPLGSTTVLTFDYTFTNPMIVGNGECYVNETTAHAAGGDAYILAQVYHVSVSGTETLLGSEQSFKIQNYDNAVHLQRFMITSKAFAIGEQLRLKVSLTPSDAKAYIYHDPSSSKTLTESGPGRTLPISLVLTIPFRIIT